MAKKKLKKERDKADLCRVKKEMAAPRMASSVRDQEMSQNAPAGRAGSD
jgi:hypothetical protein